jgi:aryl-alcohol dehydrogenase-like predicted oxidoreductase
LASAWWSRAWLSRASAEPAAIPRRALGSTGEQVSIVGLGGFHIGVQKDPGESIRLIRTALDAGVNFLDNCWDYNDGESERRMGQALRDGYRSAAFLMSKIDGRTRVAAAKQIDESLQRLQTDRIDLMQVHEVIRETVRSMRCWPRARPARFATSASPGTRARRSTRRCSTSRRATTSSSTRSRCR